MTTITATEPTTQTFTVTDLGEGNWEVEAPNDTWTITSTSGGQAADDSFFVEAEHNHHLATGWYDTLDEAIEHVRRYGVDRRRKA